MTKADWKSQPVRAPDLQLLTDPCADQFQLLPRDRKGRIHIWGFHGEIHEIPNSWMVYGWKIQTQMDDKCGIPLGKLHMTPCEVAESPTPRWEWTEESAHRSDRFAGTGGRTSCRPDDVMIVWCEYKSTSIQLAARVHR